MNIFLKQYGFLKNLNLDKNDEKSDKNLINQLEGYYRFCLCSFEDLLNEIEQFNKNADSLIYKISSILEKFEFYQKIENLKNLTFEDLKGLKDFKNFKNYENLKQSLPNFYFENLTKLQNSENFKIYKSFLLENKYLNLTKLAEKFNFDFDFKFNFDFSFIFNFNFDFVNKRYQNIKNYLDSLYESIKLRSDIAYVNIETKTAKLKKWINSIECVKSTKEKTYENFNRTKIFYEKISKNINSNFNFTEKVNFLKENFTLNLNLNLHSLSIQETGQKYFCAIKDSSIEKINFVKRILINFLTIYAKKFNESFNYLKLNQGKPLFRIYTDEDNYFSIEINKNFLPENFFTFVNFLRKFMKENFIFEYVFYLNRNNYNNKKEIKAIKSVEEKKEDNKDDKENENDKEEKSNDNKEHIKEE